MMEVTERNVTSDNNQRSKFTDGDTWHTDMSIKVNGTWTGVENLLQIHQVAVLKSNEICKYKKLFNSLTFDTKQIITYKDKNELTVSISIES